LGMREITVPLRSVEQTGRAMHRLIREYENDVALNAAMPLHEFYHHVKMIPYAPDPKGHEYIRRPQASMLGLGPGLDCDDRCIMLCAWARLNGVRYRVIATGRERIVSHVFPLFFIEPVPGKGKWLPVDATYPRNTLFCFMYKPGVVKELFP